MAERKKQTAKELLAEMDARYTVVMLGGKTRIAGWEERDVGGGRTAKSITFSGVEDLRLLWANRFVTVTNKSPTGEDVVTQVPLYGIWMKRADRPTAIGFTIDPKGGRFVDGRLNLWQGFTVEPKPGDWSLLRRHVEEVICNGNAEHADYLLRYIAFAFQNPTRQSEVVVVMRGRQGTGKGTLAGLVCELFGAHGIQISDRHQLTGHFNAHLLQTCFLFADEAFWAGDKQAEGTLKRMATESTLTFEPKGVNAFTGPNMLTVMMASNEKWVVPAGEDDRRFVVFDVSDARREDFAYFAAIRKELDSGGREAFLHDMLTMDLQGWHPRDDRPVTQARAEQIAETASPLVHWLGNILADGVLPYKARNASGVLRDVVSASDPALAHADPLRLDATANVKHLKAHAFWTFLDEHGIVKDEKARRASGRFRRFPPLPEARRRFMELHPWWQPALDDDGKDWEMPHEAEKARDLANLIAHEAEDEKW